MWSDVPARGEAGSDAHRPCRRCAAGVAAPALCGAVARPAVRRAPAARPAPACRRLSKSSAGGARTRLGAADHRYKSKSESIRVSNTPKDSEQQTTSTSAHLSRARRPAQMTRSGWAPGPASHTKGERTPPAAREGSRRSVEHGGEDSKRCGPRPAHSLIPNWQRRAVTRPSCWLNASP